MGQAARTDTMARGGVGDCAAAQRVAFITIGQSPRSDMVPEILSHLDAEIEPLEYGVLDGLPIETLRAHAPRPGEQSLITRLSDGNDVVLSKTWVQRRLMEMCQEILDDRIDIIVLLSTGLFTQFRPLCTTINSQRVIDRTIETLAAAGLTIGLIVPLAEQIEDIVKHGAASGQTLGAAALPGDEAALANAVRSLGGCDIVILHSVSYGEADRAVAIDASGKAGRFGAPRRRRNLV